MIIPLLHIPLIMSVNEGSLYPVRLQFHDGYTYVFEDPDTRLPYRQYYELEMRFKEFRDLNDQLRESVLGFEVLLDGLAGERGGVDKMMLVDSLLKTLKAQADNADEVFYTWRALFYQHHPM